MFDVPVPEVTVSSVPAFIDGIGQTTQTPLRTPQVASALLNALPVLTQSNQKSNQTQTSPQLVVEAQEGDVQTLLPNGSFQRLEPLNLAAATDALEKVFAYSLGNLPTQATAASPLSASETRTAALASPDSLAPDVGLQSSVPQPHADGIDLAQLTSGLISSDALHQCIDVSYEAVAPQSIPTTTLQVWSRGTYRGDIRSVENVDDVVRSLKEILVDESFNPDAIAPVLGTEQPAIDLGNDITLQVLSQAATDELPRTAVDTSSLSKQWAAIVWSDQLRQKLGATPLDPGNIQVMLKELQPAGQQLNGTASWYGPYFHGRLTANGETFDQNTLTAAHKTLPFGTILQVRNLKNNRTVVVRINDRGPYIGKRSLDLSKAAAQCLGSETAGVIPYEATILESVSVE
ncbi:rare lipoprotein a [Leptolyngbya sp. Heron Island J]|uniref:septal ring lytic transglycosylase RlpA family protein n=1 Tax=Leptolyngbya sp. Heron Island J TaxID=1385935 RepID=UPI0003B985EF|nr:septal ring lytic transglycosylase RlpA family protein [Leptolyngbya sp. Heron Island J]ESA33452.1 rare lipoprotein a [Leptolyngbya sp. Heron Island J]